MQSTTAPDVALSDVGERVDAIAGVVADSVVPVLSILEGEVDAKMLHEAAANLVPESVIADVRVVIAGIGVWYAGEFNTVIRREASRRRVSPKRWLKPPTGEWLVADTVPSVVSLSAALVEFRQAVEATAAILLRESGWRRWLIPTAKVAIGAAAVGATVLTEGLAAPLIGPLVGLLKGSGRRPLAEQSENLMRAAEALEARVQTLTTTVVDIVTAKWSAEVAVASSDIAAVPTRTWGRWLAIIIGVIVIMTVVAVAARFWR